MKLEVLLKGLAYVVTQGTHNVEIESICWDSRKVKQNILMEKFENPGGGKNYEVNKGL